ncbi:MAG: hypothetical protein WC524_07645 [Candidatus Aminicenantales bacterium]|jgi:Spy/CpxP family protein refolding chaperone|nr:hypothetical protein [Acidobacteriota bacterium]
MKNKYKLWVALSMIVVFGLGIAVGVFGDRAYLKKNRPKSGQRPEPFPTVEVMARELQLTPEQKARLKEVFKQSEERFEAFGKEIHSHLQELRGQLKTDIDNVLTPEQQKKMQEMMDRYMEQRKKASPDRRREKTKDQMPPNEENKGERR